MIRAIWSIRSNLIRGSQAQTTDIGQMDRTDPNTFIEPIIVQWGFQHIWLSANTCTIQCTDTWYTTCIIHCTWYMILYQIGFHARMPHMLQLTPDNICRTAAAVRIKDLTKQHFVMWGGFRHILLQLLSLFVSMSKKSILLSSFLGLFVCIWSFSFSDLIEICIDSIIHCYIC